MLQDAAVIEGRIVEMLKDKPMSQAALAQAMNAAATSTQQRLKRLEHEAWRGDDGLWSSL
jgi:hypothetical protein